MAKITIGGNEYTIPEMNFEAVERAWPYIEEATVTLDPIKGPSAGLRIVASGLMEADWFRNEDFGIPATVLDPNQVFDQLTAYLKKKLKFKEIGAVRVVLFEIMKEAGLDEDEQGEPNLAGQENPPSHLMETAPNTSQSSLPLDVKEEAGS